MFKRIYFALTFSNEETNTLLTYRQALIACAKEIKPIPENSMHMTLAFIGEVNDEMVKSMQEVRRLVHFEPFTFKIDQIGYFPERDKRLYYLTSSNDQALYELQKQLTDVLKARQLPFHDKAFLPHLTLGRKVILKNEPDFPIDLTIHVSEFHLLESIPYKNTRIGRLIDG